MGKIFGACLLSMAFATSAMAGTKICFWVGGNEGNKGDKVVAKIGINSVTVKDLGGDTWNGKYPRAGSLKGRDGITYFQYDAGFNEGSNTLLVASQLLQAETTGMLKFRGRGEGFFEAKYFCRDNK